MSDDLEKEWAQALEEQQQGEVALTAEEGETEADWNAALEEQHNAENEPGPPPQTGVANSSISQEAASPTTNNLGMKTLLSIPLKLSVRLGETKMLVNDLRQLGQGSIIELNKLAGAHMDLLINDCLLGQGEVVVVNEHFGIRVVEILSLPDRIKSLAC